MNLTPMRYKSYTWPHNPRVYSIDFQRPVAVHKTPFGRYQLQDLGLGHRVMEGEGEFVGPGAYEEFQRLACVFYEDGPGLLVHPLWQVANAYFVSLRVEQEPRPDYVRYAFTFWEEHGLYNGLATRVTGGGRRAGGGGDGAGGRAGRLPPGGQGGDPLGSGRAVWGLAGGAGGPESPD